MIACLFLSYLQLLLLPNTHHYSDVIMTTMASQITSLTVVYSTVYSDANQRKHQSSVSLAFVWGIHRDRWIPRTKGQLRGKCFHLMTSSWHFCPITVTSHSVTVSKLPAAQLFVKQLAQPRETTKKTSKFHITGPLWVECNGHWRVPHGLSYLNEGRGFVLWRDYMHCNEISNLRILISFHFLKHSDS